MSPVPSVCLVVLDGWGLAPEGPGNAVALAETPVMDRIWAEHPHTTLTACGESVGLPAGQMGNSEVGHLNLGAGAIVPQDLARIDKAAGQAVRILYGGSLKPDGAEDLLSLPDIDGGLIGGASLDPKDFASLVQTAARLVTPA